ncbi:MAG: DUF2339 domain-containing protein [Candidatus Hydrogenedentes bacterium]|nr:DUF2339 domain-containing protein [Candidatus Hydrogenedentota bacterium]
MERSDEILDLRKRVEELERDLQQVRVRLDGLEGTDAAADLPNFSAQFELPPAPAAPPSAPEPVIAATVAPPPLPATRPLAPPPVPRPAGPPVRREPGFFSALFEQLRGYGPPKDMPWEMALGTWWLPRIGVLVLSVAVVWLLSLALDRIPQAWLPWIRLAIGYGIALGLMAFGKWAEKRDKGYARVVMGGGLGLLYLATFATYYIPYTRVVPVPAPTLLALGILVAWWTALAQWRRSRLMAVVVTALGQFTVALSTLTLPQPSSFGVAGLIAIALGSAFFLARNGWYVAAALGMLMSHGNYFLWLARSPGSTAVSAFLMGMHLVLLFFLIFAAADFLAPDPVRRERLALKLRTGYVTTNSAAALLLALMLMEGFTFTRGSLELLYWGFGTLLLAISAAYAVLRRNDPLYHAYLVKGIVLITIGLAVYLEGSRLTATLAVESVVLLWASRRPGMVSTRLLSFGTAALALLLATTQILLDIAGGPVVPLTDAIVTTAAFIVLALLYQWTDWTPYSNQRMRRPAVQQLLWNLDLAAAPPESAAEPRKPLEGWLLPYAFSVAAAALIVLQSIALADEYVGVATAGIAALILAVAVGGRSRALSLCALLCTAAAGVLQLNLMLNASGPDTVTFAVVALGLVLALASERRYLPASEGLRHFHAPGIAYALYVLPALVVILHFAELPIHPWPVTMLLCALIAAGLTLLLHPGALGVAAVLFMLASGLHYWRAIDMHKAPEMAMHLLFWANAAVSIGLERYFAARGKAQPFQFLGSILLVLAALLIGVYVYEAVSEDWQSFVYALFALAFLAHAAYTRRITSAALAIGPALIATAYHVFTANDADGLLASFVLGNAVWLVLWVVLERGAAAVSLQKTYAEMRDQCLPIVVAIAVAIITAFVYDLTGPYLSIGWTIAAVALIGVSIPLGQRYYRYGGLLLLLVVLGRVFLIDTARLDPIFRIAAGGFLGLVLLALGFGYVKARERGRISEKESAGARKE